MPVSDIYNPYIRSKREHDQALIMLKEAHALEAHRERLVKEGKMTKVVEYDPVQRLTKIWYKRV